MEEETYELLPDLANLTGLDDASDSVLGDGVLVGEELDSGGLAELGSEAGVDVVDLGLEVARERRRGLEVGVRGVGLRGGKR
jgi:hypothetical protein